MTFNSLNFRISKFFPRPTRRLFTKSGRKRISLKCFDQFQYEKKIDLFDQLQVNYGRHRSGWKYALQFLSGLHHPQGVLFDAFIERTFCWHPGGVKPHTRPWVGVVHVPPTVPDWFLGEQANDAVFKTQAWLDSAPFCRGLYVLTEYHRKVLTEKVQMPVNRLFFPSEVPTNCWSWEQFCSNREKRIVQVGWWLRRLHAIYQLPQTTYKKTLLDASHPILPKLFSKERELFEQDGLLHPDMHRTVDIIPFLSDDLYDLMLGKNIVFLNLYDASANNAVIECILRNTPLLINPIEPVKEYLGENYPFYYESLEEAAQKAMDFDLVLKTHLYLVDLPIKEKLTGRFFLDSVANSPIYQGLPSRS